jgi:hypothetical protein
MTSLNSSNLAGTVAALQVQSDRNAEDIASLSSLSGTSQLVVAVNSAVALSGTSALVATVAGLRDNTLISSTLVSTMTSLSTRIAAAEGLSGTSALVTTVGGLRDNSGTGALLMTVSSLSSRLTAVEDLDSSLNSSGIVAAVLALQSTANTHNVQIGNLIDSLGDVMELNPTSSVLYSTLSNLRDLSGSSTLTVDALRDNVGALVTALSSLNATTAALVKSATAVGAAAGDSQSIFDTLAGRDRRHQWQLHAGSDSCWSARPDYAVEPSASNHECVAVGDRVILAAGSWWIATNLRHIGLGRIYPPFKFCATLLAEHYCACWRERILRSFRFRQTQRPVVNGWILVCRIEQGSARLLSIFVRRLESHVSRACCLVLSSQGIRCPVDPRLRRHSTVRCAQ